MTNAVLLYLPVLHKGYLTFLEHYRGPNVECLLLGRDALLALGPEAEYILRKDKAIRGLPETVARNVIENLGFFGSVKVLDPADTRILESLVCPDEDVSRLAAERFFPGVETVFDDKVRLRYDRKGVDRVDPIPETAAVTSEEAHRMLMGKAEAWATRSRDWWLHVGGLIAKDGTPVLFGFNKAVPDADMTNILGDPRSLYRRGEGTDDTLVDHVERNLVSRAACDGIALRGADMYVTHFPCGPCAAGIAAAKIGRLFFRNGYSRLESAHTLEVAGVEIIRVL